MGNEPGIDSSDLVFSSLGTAPARAAVVEAGAVEAMTSPPSESSSIWPSASRKEVSGDYLT